MRCLWPIASHLEQVARELWPELWLADPGPPNSCCKHPATATSWSAAKSAARAGAVVRRIWLHRGLAQNSSKSHEACKSSMSGMRCNRCCWLWRVFWSWCWMYASDPTGVPRMVSPCSWGGKCWLPAQTSGPRGSKPGGVVPTGVPDACFPTVELDVGVLEKFAGHEVVDCSNSIGLDDGVKIV